MTGTRLHDGWFPKSLSIFSEQVFLSTALEGYMIIKYISLLQELLLHDGWFPKSLSIFSEQVFLSTALEGYMIIKYISLLQESFMTKQLNKSIMARSKLRNRYLRWPSKENFLNYNWAKNTCNILDKFTKKYYFDKVTCKGFVSNKAFWNTVKPFLMTKGFLTNENIAIKHGNK